MNSTIRGVIAVIYLALCVVLGGASAAGAMANAFLQGFAILIILVLMWSGKAVLPREARPLVWLAAAFLGWCLLTLVPLPGGLWQGLAYRGEIARGMQLLGLGEPSLPASLAPRSTVASLLWLLPPAAMFLLVLTLRGQHRRWLCATVAVLAVVSIVVGIFQLFGGERSAFYFYAITNRGFAVGLFANVNHQATLLLCALPCTAVLAAQFATRADPSKRSGGLIIASTFAIFLTAGIALAGSEAGYGLFVPTALASLLIYRRATAGTVGRIWQGVLAAVLVAFVAFALAGPMSRQTLSEKYSGAESSRRVLATTTIEAIADTFPVGSGLGTFSNLYRRYEDPLKATREFANHAHNDYLEFVLELGAAGLLLILLFAAWAVRRGVQAWRFDSSGAAAARAGSVIVGLVMLHSIVDYPLRTSAIAAVFAMACAALVPPVQRAARARADKDGAEEAGPRHLEAV